MAIPLSWDARKVSMTKSGSLTEVKHSLQTFFLQELSDYNQGDSNSNSFLEVPLLVGLIAKAQV